MIYDDDNDNHRDNEQDDLQNYLSNGKDKTTKPWEDKDFVDYDMNKYENDEEPLSINDLIIAAPKNEDPQPITPQFSQVEEQQETVP